MSEHEHTEEAPSEEQREEMQDLDVSEEEAQDVKGGQEMPPFPRQQR